MSSDDKAGTIVLKKTTLPGVRNEDSGKKLDGSVPVVVILYPPNMTNLGRRYSLGSLRISEPSRSGSGSGR